MLEARARFDCRNGGRAVRANPRSCHWKWHSQGSSVLSYACSSLTTNERQYHEAQGTKFYLPAALSHFKPSTSSPSAVSAVVLKDGTEIPADLVILGVGVKPATAVLKSSGLDLEKDGSVLVDGQLRIKAVSKGNVFAVGDIATYPDSVTGDSVRVEHWNVASVRPSSPLAPWRVLIPSRRTTLVPSPRPSLELRTPRSTRFPSSGARRASSFATPGRPKPKIGRTYSSRASLTRSSLSHITRVRCSAFLWRGDEADTEQRGTRSLRLRRCRATRSSRACRSSLRSKRC